MNSKWAFAFFLVAVVFVTYAPSEAYVYRTPSSYTAGQKKSHDMIAGSRLPGDRLVHREYIVRSSSPGEITIQRIFSAPRFEKITQVRALDQTNNGTGGYANIVRGGPGLGNVTINFTSQRNYGLRFLIQIYSRR
ncbi:probable salivary secreted peptide [Diachasma alloeum]|uniref:probable salivary secreted peptide n=1 Tax=Diachasma alloeum TaxID=454923 RepID=UPI0007381BFE|nr:probable salivary secreted peptide [Diachasma alloeum]